jgi:hypothetical protein
MDVAFEEEEVEHEKDQVCPEPAEEKLTGRFVPREPQGSGQIEARGERETPEREPLERGFRGQPERAKAPTGNDREANQHHDQQGKIGGLNDEFPHGG